MYCEVTDHPIDVLEVMRHVRSDADGAVILFTGVVRDHADGRAVVGIEYDAYREMAVSVLERICADVREAPGVGDVAIVHRVGELEVGEASVAIAVAAPHRDEAYRASREIIERLKREVPIWKRERYADGEAEWRKGIAPQVPGTR